MSKAPCLKLSRTTASACLNIYFAPLLSQIPCSYILLHLLYNSFLVSNVNTQGLALQCSSYIMASCSTANTNRAQEAHPLCMSQKMDTMYIITKITPTSEITAI